MSNVNYFGYTIRTPNERLEPINRYLDGLLGKEKVLEGRREGDSYNRLITEELAYPNFARLRSQGFVSHQSMRNRLYFELSDLVDDTIENKKAITPEAIKAALAQLSGEDTNHGQAEFLYRRAEAIVQDLLDQESAKGAGSGIQRKSR